MRRFDNTREYIGGKLDDITVIFGEVIIEDVNYFDNIINKI